MNNEELDSRVLLLEDMSRTISDKLDILKRNARLLKTLDDPHEATVKLTLLVCYIKRKCNFYFLEIDHEYMKLNELAVFIDELAEIAEFAGLRIISICPRDEQVLVSRASLMYSFFYECMLIVLNNECTSMFEQIVVEEDSLSIRIMPSKKINDISRQIAVFDTLKSLGGRFEFKESEDTCGFWLIFDRPAKNGQGGLIYRGREDLNRLLKTCDTQAVLQARTRAHDLLGQRLTMLLKMLRYGETPFDCAQLADACDSLDAELKSSEFTISVMDELQALCKMFKSVGINVEVSGSLHESSAVNAIIFDIIREAVTNAVRHGLASRVTVRMGIDDDGVYRMKISDNGTGCAEIHSEGQGLSGMRKKLEEISGTLLVTPYPVFTIEVSV